MVSSIAWRCPGRVRRNEGKVDPSLSRSGRSREDDERELIVRAGMIGGHPPAPLHTRTRSPKTIAHGISVFVARRTRRPRGIPPPFLAPEGRKGGKAGVLVLQASVRLQQQGGKMQESHTRSAVRCSTASAPGTCCTPPTAPHPPPVASIAMPSRPSRGRRHCLSSHPHTPPETSGDRGQTYRPSHTPSESTAPAYDDACADKVKVPRQPSAHQRRRRAGHGGVLVEDCRTGASSLDAA